MTELHPARDRLALALDVTTLESAVALLRLLRPWFGVAKVGLELFSAVGPSAISTVRSEGFEVFADLKLHDIPNTVGRAAHVIGASGARYLTTHTVGGEAMVRAAVEGFEGGAGKAGHARPILLGVSVLTSDGDAGPETFDRRVRLAAAAGCPGLVCSALDVVRARALHPVAVVVCPGIRPAHSGADDQVRVATPANAIRAGADMLVVGRPVTGAPDPARVASMIADEVLASLDR